MNIKAHLRTALIVGSLAGLFVALFPASAAADGYYHYTAYDMDIKEGLNNCCDRAGVFALPRTRRTERSWREENK